MITTRYVTGDAVGVLTLVARAVDPNGNPITQQTTITINPVPTLPKCYNAILALGTLQDSIELACSQFGALNTYYLGDPNGTVYTTDSCSDVARDGFYKTEDGNWVNINAGAIRQRGMCTKAVRREGVPQQINIGGITNLVNTVPPIAVRIPGQPDRGEDFVQKPSFTLPAPTLVPIKETFVNQTQTLSNLARIPLTGPKTKEIAPTNPEALISRARSLGIKVPSDIANIISLPSNIRSKRGFIQAARLTILRQQVQREIDKQERQRSGGVIPQGNDSTGVIPQGNNPTIADTNTEV